MTETQLTELWTTLQGLRRTRGEDALKTLGAVAGIPYRRIKQLADGEGAPATVMEHTTIMMLK